MIIGSEEPRIQGIFFTDFARSFIPHILKEIYIDRVYDTFLSGTKDLVIVDLGANVGLWSMYAYPHAKKIYAFEPSQDHFDCLVTMVMSGNIHNIQPIQCAIDGSAGTGKLYHQPNATAHNLLMSHDEESETVRTITIADVFNEIKEDHIDVLKVDIEGSEAAVFGSESFDEVKDKIDLIIGEFHSWTGIQMSQFKSYFVDRGFTFRWLDETESTTFVAERIE